MKHPGGGKPATAEARRRRLTAGVFHPAAICAFSQRRHRCRNDCSHQELPTDDGGVGVYGKRNATPEVSEVEGNTTTSPSRTGVASDSRGHLSARLCQPPAGPTCAQTEPRSQVPEGVYTAVGPNPVVGSGSVHHEMPKAAAFVVDLSITSRRLSCSGSSPAWRCRFGVVERSGL